MSMRVHHNLASGILTSASMNGQANLKNHSQIRLLKAVDFATLGKDGLDCCRSHAGMAFVGTRPRFP